MTYFSAQTVILIDPVQTGVSRHTIHDHCETILHFKRNPEHDILTFLYYRPTFSTADLKGIYPEFQVIRGFSQKIPAGLLSHDQIHS